MVGGGGVAGIYCKLRPPTPADRLSPDSTCNETGCREIVLLLPPMSTAPPGPAPTSSNPRNAKITSPHADMIQVDQILL